MDTFQEPGPFEARRVAARREHAWRVLVVDDDASVRRSLERYLASAGFEVIVAGDIDQALDQLAGGPVSAAVLDVRMPDTTGRRRTGLEVLSYLRLQPEFAAVPVIVFTGVPPTRSQQADIDEQGAHVLLKGQSYAGLVDRLDELLGA